VTDGPIDCGAYVHQLSTNCGGGEYGSGSI
jgi:hypothetical protein